MSAIPKYLGDQAVTPAGPRLLVEWEPRWRGFASSIGPALARIRCVAFHGGPALLVRWERPWESFTSSLKPALARSEPRLAGECTVTMRAGPGTFASALLHVAGILCLVLLPLRIAQLDFSSPPAPEPQYQVIYYSGQELPQMNDAGGAQEGASGRAGGRELYHPTQTIRMVRGSTKLVSTIVDAPQLKLPHTNEPVANLVSMPGGDPGPAPAAGMRSLMAAANLLPAPPVIPAAPNVKRAKLLATPQLAAGAVGAAPDTKREIAGLKMPAIGTEPVLPPPVSAPATNINSTPALALPVAVAVAPPPDLSSSSMSAKGVPGFGARQDVVPPAVQPGGRALNGSPLGALDGFAGMGAAAPLPSAGMGNGANGLAGTAKKGSGALLRSSGSGTGGGGTGVIVSAHPGTAVGVPGGSSSGAIAMSPAGGNQPGYGGSGGGTGIGRGTGPGSGSHGSGPGSGTSGTGLGSGASRPGISPYPGPGGSGSGTGSPVPGLTVIGGSINIPGFSSPEDSYGASHRTTDSRGRPPITIIATARSGGALPVYDGFKFKGAKVYTIYIDTKLGTAVLQYAERAVSKTNFEQDLTPPELVRAELPEVPRSRLLVSCILDQSGALKNIRTVESARNASTTAILTALEDWRFRPVLRGDEPVDVDVILGFGVDTR